MHVLWPRYTGLESERASTTPDTARPTRYPVGSAEAGVRYTPTGYATLTKPIDPVLWHGDCYIKHGEFFVLDGPVAVVGSKVRQCLHVVHENLARIRDEFNGGIVTGAGLPSPQTAIVAAVAHYFGLKCAVTTPRFENGKFNDYNRINASIAQRCGASVYGVGNPNPSGYEKDAKELCKELGYFQIKFGMFGDVAMEPVIRQVENVPESIRDIVIVSGSGLSALSILRGLVRFQKPVERVHIVKLSGHVHENYTKWYENQPEKFDGEVNFVESAYPYRYELTSYPNVDYTYESKAWDWMVKHLVPKKSLSTLFWTVGLREYSRSFIVPIEWHMSAHERTIRHPARLFP
jgi:hypothetical protein